MKAYWDSGALVAATADVPIRNRLRQERGFTRTHALSEVFSALTGGRLAIRLEADDAAEVLDNLAEDLDFIDLDAGEVLAALKQARQHGVRGGRIHDFLHAVAADKSDVQELLTTDQFDFTSLTPLKVVVV